MVFGLAAACGSEACPAGERTSRRSKVLRRRALAREARRRKFSTRLPEENLAREARQNKSGTVGGRGRRRRSIAPTPPHPLYQSEGERRNWGPRVGGRNLEVGVLHILISGWAR